MPELNTMKEVVKIGDILNSHITEENEISYEIAFLEKENQLSLLKDAEELYPKSNWEYKKMLRSIINCCIVYLVDNNNNPRKEELKLLLEVPCNAKPKDLLELTYEDISNAFHRLEKIPEVLSKYWVTSETIAERISQDSQFISRLLRYGKIDLSELPEAEKANQVLIEELKALIETASSYIKQQS